MSPPCFADGSRLEEVAVKLRNAMGFGSHNLWSLYIDYGFLDFIGFLVALIHDLKHCFC